MGFARELHEDGPQEESVTGSEGLSAPNHFAAVGDILSGAGVVRSANRGASKSYGSAATVISESGTLGER
jgi:hypothetical protein